VLEQYGAIVTTHLTARRLLKYIQCQAPRPASAVVLERASFPY
jgi:hypothetical protein